MKNTVKWIVCLTFLTIWGCKEKTTSLEPLDLLSYGLSIKINAPVQSVVKAEDLGIAKDVTVRDSASGYNLQIFESEATALDATKILTDLQSTIEASAFFDEIVSADNQGFIYKKVIDEDYINYDFRHIKIRGDRLYTFQAGLSTQYTLEEIQIMYKSVL